MVHLLQLLDSPTGIVCTGLFLVGCSTLMNTYEHKVHAATRAFQARMGMVVKECDRIIGELKATKGFTLRGKDETVHVQFKESKRN